LVTDELPSRWGWSLLFVTCLLGTLLSLAVMACSRGNVPKWVPLANLAFDISLLGVTDSFLSHLRLEHFLRSPLSLNSQILEFGRIYIRGGRLCVSRIPFMLGLPLFFVSAAANIMLLRPWPKLFLVLPVIVLSLATNWHASRRTWVLEIDKGWFSFRLPRLGRFSFPIQALSCWVVGPAPVGRPVTWSSRKGLQFQPRGIALSLEAESGTILPLLRMGCGQSGRLVAIKVGQELSRVTDLPFELRELSHRDPEKVSHA
jgi:hypothetical protein